MNVIALWVGYAACAIGGLVVLALLLWGAMELWWRQIRTAGMLNDIYQWKRAGKPGARIMRTLSGVEREHRRK